MFGPYRIPYIDSLYFWDSNVDHRVGRAMMARNFSNISVGVLKQVWWGADALCWFRVKAGVTCCCQALHGRPYGLVSVERCCSVSTHSLAW